MKQHRLLLCRSQSEAMILSGRLSACGISGKLTRPPRSRQVRSCAWAIEIDSRLSEQAEQCLEKAGITSDLWCWEDGNDLSG